MVAAIRSTSVASRPRPMTFDMSDIPREPREPRESRERRELHDARDPGDSWNELPQPTDAFAWVQADAGPALVCRPLAELAPHLYTTRHCALGSGTAGEYTSGWAEIADAMGLVATYLR